MKIIWSPLAMDRIAEIAAYISENNLSAAEKWIRDIFARAGQISRFPESGRHLAETSRKDIREIIWGNYRLVYRLAAREIAILTVRHSKQIIPVEDLK